MNNNGNRDAQNGHRNHPGFEEVKGARGGCAARARNDEIVRSQEREICLHEPFTGGRGRFDRDLFDRAVNAIMGESSDESDALNVSRVNIVHPDQVVLLDCEIFELGPKQEKKPARARSPQIQGVLLNIERATIADNMH